MTTLFPHLSFRPDETPISWIGRLAEFHTGGGVYAFSTDLKFSLSAVQLGDIATIRRICEITGQDPEPVLRNTATSDGESLYTLRGEQFPAMMLTREETRFCPLCLASDDRDHNGHGPARYGRLIWTVRHVKLCPEHGIPLIKRRGMLHANLAHELRVFVPETTDQLVELAAETPPEVPTALAAYLVNRIAGQAGPVWLDGQTIEQAVKATEMLGASLVFGPKFSFKSATEAEWDEAREAGWRYTSRGEVGVQGAFANLQGRAANKGIGGIDYGSVFTHLYAWLAQKKAPDYHGPIKQSLRNYIQDEMEVSIGLKLFGVPLERREKISVRWLAADSGVGEALLAPYLAKKGLLSEDQLTFSSRLQLVDRHPAEDLANHLANAVSLTDLIPALGATPVLVASLLETEMIVPMVMAAHHTGPSKGLVAREAVDQLLDQLDEITSVPDTVPDNWVSMAQCTKRARISREELLAFMFGGRIKGIARNADEIGFAAIRLDLDEVKTLAA